MNTHIANRRTRQLAAMVAAVALIAAACSSGSDDNLAAVETVDTESAVTTTELALPTTTIDPWMEPIPDEAVNLDLPESVEPEYRLGSSDVVNDDSDSAVKGAVPAVSSTTSVAVVATTNPPTTTTISPLTADVTKTGAATKPATTTTSGATTTTSGAATTTTTTGATTTTEPATTTTTTAATTTTQVTTTFVTWTDEKITDPACYTAMVEWYEALVGEPNGLVTFYEKTDQTDVTDVSSMTAYEKRTLTNASRIALEAWTKAHTVCREAPEVDNPDTLHNQMEHEWVEHARGWAERIYGSYTTSTGMTVTHTRCITAIKAWNEALDALIAVINETDSWAETDEDGMRRSRKASNVAKDAWDSAQYKCGEVFANPGLLFTSNEREWAEEALYWTIGIDIDAAEAGYWCTESAKLFGDCDTVDDPYIAIFSPAYVEPNELGQRIGPRRPDIQRLIDARKARLSR